MFSLVIPALAVLPLVAAEWVWTPGTTAWVAVVATVGGLIVLCSIGACIRSMVIADRFRQQYRTPPPLPGTPGYTNYTISVSVRWEREGR